MPSYFGDFPIGAQTKHFLVTFADENDADALARARAIGDSCENDLSVLEEWFDRDYDRSPYGIWVHVAPGVHLGGASNTGYSSQESSKIRIFGTFAPPGAPPNPTLRDELARMVFVAELAEILMDLTGPLWNRRDSMGEGLSILAAQTLHPNGYYATGSGPRIGSWLTGSRPDWISATEETDTNTVSYGCAVLFLNYLRYQRGFSFPQIVAAAGPYQALPPAVRPPLAAVFSTLTGRPVASAYKEFTDLLEAHIPAGKPFNVISDNVFPLQDAKRRRVSFTHFESEVNALKDPEALLVARRPGPMCPSNAYTYHNINVSSVIAVNGRAVGFASPQFSWEVNGIKLTSAGPQLTNVPMSATDTVPGPGEPPVAVSLPVKYVVSSSGFETVLVIFNQTFPGNGDLTISLSAAESLVGFDPPTRHSEAVQMLTRRYSMSAAWAIDVARCNIKSLTSDTLTVKSLARRLVEDENRPNPNPGLIRALATAARQYVETLDEVTGGSRGLDLAAAAALSDPALNPPAPLTFHDASTGLLIFSKADDARTPVPPVPHARHGSVSD
jgi:hypothetical protein